MFSYREAEFLISANEPRQFPPDSGAEVAFAGRSNAGKSSALNCISERRGLARTSKTPGRTQLINFFGLPDGRRLVDLPGYGFAKVPDAMRRHWRGLMEAYFSGRRSLQGLMLIMDVRRPMLEFDQLMLVWAEEAGCPVHVLLTKADKLSRNQASATLHKVRTSLPASCGVQLFSATRKTGADEAREALSKLLES